jgi:hypothetical protein
MWRAAITDAGRFYLDHGHHPDRPDERLSDKHDQIASTGHRSQPTSRDDAPSARQASAGGTRLSTTQSLARQLIEQLQRQGGTITIESPDDQTRARYRRAIHAAKQHKLVPEGFHLRHTGRASGDLIISLSDDQEPDDTNWNRIRLNARRVTSDSSLVLAALENHRAGIHVSEACMPRALDLIRSLAEECRHHGYRLGVNTRTARPKLFLQIDTRTRRSVELHEEYDEIPHVLTDQERRQLRREPWRRPPEVDKVPAGRLRLEIGRAGWSTNDRWMDEKRSPLEKRLPKILRDVEGGIAADEEARRAAQRAHEEHLAEMRREEEEEEETRNKWQAALDAAHPKAVEAIRRKTFRVAYDAWAAACEIRAFCDALEQATPDSECFGDQRAWVTWGREAADRIDPTHGDNTFSSTSFNVTPGPDDLRPFLGDWSPREPRHEYRSERDQERLNSMRIQADAWHLGMRGRPSWWRHR